MKRYPQHSILVRTVFLLAVTSSAVFFPRTAAADELKTSVKIEMKVVEIENDVYLANKEKIDAGVAKGDLGLFSLLNNLKGVSLVSAPSVTTQPELKANIDIVREYPVPTSYAIHEQTPGVINGPLVRKMPPTPQEFVNKNVGITAEITPLPARRYTAAPGKIVLTGKFSVVTFLGMNKSNLGPEIPAFDEVETQFLEALDDGKWRVLWVPGVRFDEETVKEPGKPDIIKSIRKKILLFLSATTVK